MKSEVIPVEKLSCGLDAVFVNMPHFRTHSARLLVRAGSAHEEENAHGSAHFLEHVVFQGTEEMPTEKDVHNYTEERGLYRNASTNKVNTTYTADGYELESVSFMVTQLALKPIISSEALEGERNPIIDEMQGYFSSPHHAPSREHWKAMRGKEFARDTLGDSVEDIQRMNLEDLQGFYDRYYKVGNVALVVCSADSVDVQREMAESLTSDIAPSAKTGEPFNVEFGEFNPDGLRVSLQPLNLPETAQTSISIYYEVPEVLSVEGMVLNNLLGSVMSSAAHTRLRRELALCYSSSASVGRMTDTNFGNQKNWSQLAIGASLNGKDAVKGLDALKNDVIHQEITDKTFNAALISLRRDLDHLLQGNPSSIADRVCGVLSAGQKQEVRLDEVVEVAQKISLRALRRLHEQVISTPPFVTATSPSDKVLQQISAWAEAV